MLGANRGEMRDIMQCKEETSTHGKVKSHWDSDHECTVIHCSLKQWNKFKAIVAVICDIC